MVSPVVGTGTLSRLSALDAAGFPVLSVYLDLDRSTYPSAPARERQLKALISGVECRVAKADVDRVRKMLRCTELGCGARSLAMFSSADGTVFEAIPLPCPVEPMAVLDTIPWLEPIAGMFTTGDWGVAVLARRTARLFRGGPRMLVEFATVHDELHRRGAPGDCSRPDSHRPIEEHVVEQARRLSALLRRAHQHRAFQRLAVVAPTDLWPLIEDALDDDLRTQLAGLVELNLEHHAPAQEIAHALAPVMRPAQREETQRTLRSTTTPLTIGGPTAAAHLTSTRCLGHRVGMVAP